MNSLDLDYCLSNGLVFYNFSEKGYTNIDDLKSVTDYELKNVIPQILPRKKFSTAIIPWLIEQEQEVDENILLVSLELRRS